MACSMIPKRAPTVAATRSIASQAQSGPLTLTFNISRLPSLRNWATEGGSNGYRADLVRRRLTPELISSLPGTAGLPPFISFSINCPDLEQHSGHGSEVTRHKAAAPRESITMQH